MATIEPQAFEDSSLANAERAIGADEDAADTRRAEGLNSQGIALARQGRIEEAVACYRRALAVQPDFPDALNNLGIALAHGGRLDDAIDSYEEALAYRPEYPEAHNNLGIALARKGQLAEATVHFEEALRIKPEYPEAHNNLANALRNRGRIDEAIAGYRRALELKPDYPEACNNLANALSESNRPEEAIPLYRDAIRFNPRYAEAHNNLGNTMSKLGRPEEAERSYRRALRYNPDYSEAYNNLGNVLSEQGRLAEGVAFYRQALLLNPEYAEAHNNLAITLGKQGKVAAADACYRDALRLKPDYPEARLNRALGWLIAGNFEQGWPEYEWRWRCRGINRASFAQPAWTGEPLAGKTILLFYEQGLGDTLQFIRYAPLVKQRGGTVVVECQPQLIPLLTHCAGIDRLIPEGGPRPEFQAHCPLMSLPRIFHTTVANVPGDVPYLYADPALVASWRRSLAHLRGFRIGISWQGNPQYKGDRHRSFPLALFGPLAELPGVRLVSLQKNIGTEQVAAFAAKHEITELGEGFDQGKGAFMDTAAIMMNLDLMITSDTALAHLAGGLGVPTWMPLSWSSDWRWLERREDSPWYPTMRLFRQSEPGDWPEVFERIEAALRPMAEGSTPRRSVAVELSAGELLDRIAMLEVKAERPADAATLRETRAELERLRVTVRSLAAMGELEHLTPELREVHAQLLDAEDALQDCERETDFGPRFVALSRSMHRASQRRAALKRRIDELRVAPVENEMRGTVPA